MTATHTLTADQMLSDAMVYLGRIEQYTSHMDKQQLLALGTRLNEVVTEARLAYRGAPDKNVLESGAATLPSLQIEQPAVTEDPEPQGEAINFNMLRRPLDGTYTVIFSDNDYVTLRLETQAADAEFAPGEMIASYLNGPDNYTNYKGFAFVKADGKYHLWSSHRKGNPNPHTELALRVLIHGGKLALVNGLQAYGKRSGKCGICGRKLTTPESLELGIGPVCAGRMGL